MPRFSLTRPLASIVAVVVLAACASESSGPPAGDTTPPTVLSVTPANGATGVAAGTNVTVSFSEPVAPASVTPATFSVGSAAGTIVVTGSSATFTPSAPLASGTAHAVSVAGARDTAGNPMAAPFASTFTTFAGPAAANAGPDQHVSFAVAVTLNASASTGGGLTYAWSQIAGPAVTLTPAGGGAQAGFTAPAEPEALEFEVSVTDGATSDKDTVVVFVWEDRNHTYYVASGGNDGNAGTRAAPFATVQAAITAADVAGNGGDVYVAGGPYEQSLTLKARVSVYGGFVPGTWRRSLLSQETAIFGGTTAVTGTDAENLTLDGLTIEATNATSAGGSSIALLLNNSVNVHIHGNTIIAYGGAAGTHGVAGTNGLSGSNGDDGQSAAFCVSPREGGDGGGSYVAGGGGGTGGFAGGFDGADGGASGAVSGGGGGGGGSTFNDGDDGGNGRTGAQGSDGARGAAFGAVSPAGYIPADGLSGTNGGAHGSGGGGGGGGGGIAVGVCGAGGGGGGGGGQRGALGTGGMGGGAAIGILLLGTTTAEIVNNSITTGAGGNGGLGRTGGNGGTGGSGGDGGTRICQVPLNTPCTGVGGDGGDGGTGGRGGHGGGGGGGPSIGIVEAASATSVQSGNGFRLGTGGSGGTSPGSAGLAGETAQFKKLT